MPRYAPAMSHQDLRQVLINLALQHDYVEDYGPLDPQNPDMDRIVLMLLQEEVLKEVEKDWSKISFSTENLSVQAEKTTPDGIPYLELLVGGDWETPLIAILYFDGKKLRGFVPTNGNTFNHKKKSAFGNNDSDAKAAHEQFGTTHADGPIEVAPNLDLIAGDIAARLQAKGTHTPSSTPVVSKAKRTATRQAALEKGQDLSGPITPDMVHAVIALAAGGAYVSFKLRSSKRTLTAEESHRLVGVPASFEKTDMSYGKVLWYAPMGCYPIQAHALLQAAGFTKAPDNDLTPYEGARTVYIRL